MSHHFTTQEISWCHSPKAFPLANCVTSRVSGLPARFSLSLLSFSFFGFTFEPEIPVTEPDAVRPPGVAAGRDETEENEHDKQQPDLDVRHLVHR